MICNLRITYVKELIITKKVRFCSGGFIRSVPLGTFCSHAVVNTDANELFRYQRTACGRDLNDPTLRLPSRVSGETRSTGSKANEAVVSKFPTEVSEWREGEEELS